MQMRLSSAVPVALLLSSFGFSQTTTTATNPIEVVPGPIYHHMCDASGAAVMGTHGFIIGNDEDNTLRVYARSKGGDPILEYDLTDFLRPDPDHPEADIEGATWLGDKVFWITSHARNKDGKLRLSRYRLFATEFTKVDGRTTVQTAGSAYRFLLDDMLNDQRLEKYNLRVAMKYPPKSDFALNVEGLTSTPEGELWVGLRNPIVDHKALIISITNPLEVVNGRPAQLGDPIELDLGGLGIRAIEYHAPWQKYVILAGPKASGEVELYTWTGKQGDVPLKISGVDFGETSPEAFVCYVTDQGTELQVICDDGTREIQGTSCKALEDRQDRRFRTWLVRGLTP